VNAGGLPGSGRADPRAGPGAGRGPGEGVVVGSRGRNGAGARAKPRVTPPPFVEQKEERDVGRQVRFAEGTGEEGPRTTEDSGPAAGPTAVSHRGGIRAAEDANQAAEAGEVRGGSRPSHASATAPAVAPPEEELRMVIAEDSVVPKEPGESREPFLLLRIGVRSIGRSLLQMKPAHFAVNDEDRVLTDLGGPCGTLLPGSQPHWFVLAAPIGSPGKGASEGAADSHIVRVDHGPDERHLLYSTEMQFTLPRLTNRRNRAPRIASRARRCCQRDALPVAPATRRRTTVEHSGAKAWCDRLADASVSQPPSSPVPRRLPIRPGRRNRRFRQA